MLRVPGKLTKSLKSEEILSELIIAIGVEKIAAAQSKGSGSYLIEFRDTKVANAFKLSGLAFRGIHLTPEQAYAKATNVYVSRVPPGVSDEHFAVALAPYGKVQSIKRLYLKGFPGIQSGTRLVRVVLGESIPYFFKVWDFFATVTYAGQPPTCFKCREIGHKHADCPSPTSLRRHRKRPRVIPSTFDVASSTTPSPNSSTQNQEPLTTENLSPSLATPIIPEVVATILASPASQPPPAAVSVLKDAGTQSTLVTPSTQSVGSQCGMQPVEVPFQLKVGSSGISLEVAYSAAGAVMPKFVKESLESNAFRGSVQVPFTWDNRHSMFALTAMARAKLDEDTLTCVIRSVPCSHFKPEEPPPPGTVIMYLNDV